MSAYWVEILDTETDERRVTIIGPCETEEEAREAVQAANPNARVTRTAKAIEEI